MNCTLRYAFACMCAYLYIYFPNLLLKVSTSTRTTIMSLLSALPGIRWSSQKCSSEELSGEKNTDILTLFHTIHFHKKKNAVQRNKKYGYGTRVNLFTTYKFINLPPPATHTHPFFPPIISPRHVHEGLPVNVLIAGQFQ